MSVTLSMIERPIVNSEVRLISPHRPPPAGTPLRLASTCTLVPAFQYVLGRQCASRELSQYQEPAWAGVAVTVMCFSKLALSTTGRSKRTTTGRPMPTVPPSRGEMATSTWSSSVRFAVRNVLVLSVSLPSASLASMARVYVTRGSTATSSALAAGVVVKTTGSVVGVGEGDSDESPDAAADELAGLPLSAVAVALQAVTPSMARTANPETAVERMLDFTREYPSQT